VRLEAGRGYGLRRQSGAPTPLWIHRTHAAFTPGMSDPRPMQPNPDSSGFPLPAQSISRKASLIVDNDTHIEIFLNSSNNPKIHSCRSVGANAEESDGRVGRHERAILWRV